MVQPSRGSVVRRRLAATSRGARDASVVDDTSRLSLSTRTNEETMAAKRPPLDEVSSRARRRRRRRRDREKTSSRVVGSGRKSSVEAVKRVMGV